MSGGLLGAAYRVNSPSPRRTNRRIREGLSYVEYDLVLAYFLLKPVGFAFAVVVGVSPRLNWNRAVVGWMSVRTVRVGPVRELDSISSWDDQDCFPVAAIRISVGRGEVILEHPRPASRVWTDRWETFRWVRDREPQPGAFCFVPPESAS